MKTLIAKGIRFFAGKGFAGAGFLRIAYLRLKYPGLCIDFGTRIERGCKIVCVDGGKLNIHRSFISFGTHVFCDAGATVNITGAFIGRNCVIVAHEEIVIEDGCAIAEMVVIRDQNHQVDISNLEDTLYNFDKAPIRIGKHVWIGAKATVLKGVAVCDHAVIAASAVVVKNVPPGEIWGGVPAKYIKHYDYHSNRTIPKANVQTL